MCNRAHSSSTPKKYKLLTKKFYFSNHSVSFHYYIKHTTGFVDYISNILQHREKKFVQRHEIVYKFTPDSCIALNAYKDSELLVGILNVLI